MSIAQFSGTLYPNKTISVGICPPPKISAEDRAYECERAKIYDTYTEPVQRFGRTDYVEREFCVGGYIPPKKRGFQLIEAKMFGRQIEIAKEINKVEEGATSEMDISDLDTAFPLFINSAESSPNEKKVYGKHGITNFGRRCLENTCVLLEQRYTKKRLGFATCTLPNMERDAYDCLLSNWGDVVRRFYQKIKRLLKSRGAEFIYCGCTEIQEGRFASGGLPAPHLHFVYVSKPSVYASYLFSTKEAYTRWNSTVNEVLRKHGFDPIMGVHGHKGSCKLEDIHTNAASYIGKYVSKGIKVIQEMMDKGYTQVPKQWWTASMHCKKMYKNSLVKLTNEECEAFFYNLDDMLAEGMLTYGKYVEIEVSGEFRRFGCIAKLSPETDKIFRGTG